ncbi:MAG: PQQ-binding-like beta-propeller repeat protein [Planctomycetes bacterium]|nr:PQQ-binding-like beta-propeller repeat protein [Planctomycetota bacterium]
MSPRSSALTACALLCGVVAVARGEPEEDLRPLRAWGGRPVPSPPLDREPPLLEPAPVVSPLDGRLAELAAQGRWTELAELLVRVSDGVVLDGSTVRTRGPGQPLTSPREEVRRRLEALPGPAREAYRELVAPRTDVLLREGRRRDAPLGEALGRFAGAPAAAAAARALGERMLERGDLEGAALLWRLALARRPQPDLEARLLALRTLLGPELEGSLAPRRPAPAGAWSVSWARRAPGGDATLPRPVVADGTHLYLSDHRGVVALTREDGRLVWRAPLRGDPREQRLLLGAGQAADRLLLVRRDRLVALDAARGLVVWERPLALTGAGRPQPGQPRDRLHDAVATPAGFAALATVDGHRCLLGLSPEGDVVFEQRLWPALRGDDAPAYPYLVRYVFRPRGTEDADGNQRDHDAILGELVHDDALAPPRRVVGDGRLAAVGDRVAFTVDGVVACAAAANGALLWAREHAFGVQVAGARTVLVQLAAGPYAVEAVTAAGQLLRLDPLDGASLPLPLPPPDLHAPDPAAPPGRDEARPYVLHLSPLVLGWEPPGAGGFHITAGVPPRKVVRFAQGPLGPGALLGGTLVLPDPEGVVLLDLALGHELTETPLPWTLPAGPVAVRGGLALAVGSDGLVVFGPEARAPKVPALDDDLPLARWVDLLGHPDWRVRLSAQARLSAEAGTAEAAPLLERAARAAPTLDARDVARDLVEQAGRRRLFSTLAPTAPPSLLDAVARGEDLAERLRMLLVAHVTPRERGPDELRRLVVETEDAAVRRALLLVLVKVDAAARERLIATLRDPAQPDALRVGCAVALVEVVAARGALEPLRRALREETADEVWLWVLAAAQGCEEPDLVLELIPELQQRSFVRLPQARDVTREEALEALHDAAPRLVH